jgi:hypothetical protein
MAETPTKQLKHIQEVRAFITGFYFQSHKDLPEQDIDDTGYQYDCPTCN